MKYFTLFIALSTLLLGLCNNSPSNTSAIIPDNEDPLIVDLSNNISLNPKDHLSVAKRGYTYYEQNRFELAEADFKKAIELAPDVLNYQNLLSDLYYDFDQTDASIKVLADLIKKYPAHKETLYKKAEIEIFDNKYKAAKTTLNQLLKVDPNDANYFFLSGLNEKKNSSIIAIKHFEKCTSIDHNFIDAYIELGRLYLTIDPNKVNEVIDSNKKNFKCYVANDNSIGQVVVSGNINDLIKFSEELKKNKIKNIRLPVSAPFHCELMRSATEKMKDEILKVEFEKTEIKIMSNVTAQPTNDPNEIKKLLIEQIEKPVRWREIVINMINSNVKKFIEIGPGKVLSGLIKRIDSNVELIQVNDLEDLKNINK